jgi:2-phosphoglycolate phosphatase
VTASRAVLFDFDGTLADTAGDLAAALNHLRIQKGFKEIAVSEVRPYASMGARGLLRIGFGLTPEDADYPRLREAFLEFYDGRVCVETRLFPGMRELLDALVFRKIAWGVVTNKAARFTHRIVQALALQPGCVVCGDSTPHLKPHPAPLQLASRILGVPVENCMYVGDDLRDVQAARAAGMRPVAVEWGYHSPDHPGPRSWNAAAVIGEPRELMNLL